MELQETHLEITTQKIVDIEQELVYLNEQLNILHQAIENKIMSNKETQRYLIKLAQNQQELTKRVISWPFIMVDNKKEES